MSDDDCDFLVADSVVGAPACNDGGGQDLDHDFLGAAACNDDGGRQDLDDDFLGAAGIGTREATCEADQAAGIGIREAQLALGLAGAPATTPLALALARRRAKLPRPTVWRSRRESAADARATRGAIVARKAKESAKQMVLGGIQIANKLVVRCRQIEVVTKKGKRTVGLGLKLGVRGFTRQHSNWTISASDLSMAHSPVFGRNNIAKEHRVDPGTVSNARLQSQTAILETILESLTALAEKCE